MGKLSCKKLVKKLSPETLAKIENNQLDEIEILYALIKEAFDVDALDVSIGTVEKEVARLSPELHGKTIKHKEFEIQLDALANYAIPGQGQQFDNLRSQFLRAFGRGGISVEMSEPDTVITSIDKIMQAGFDKACDELMTKIIRKCYAGKKKAFRQHCQAYKVPRDTFHLILKDLFQKALEKHPFKEINDSYSELYRIAQQIQCGDHQGTRVCWECEEVIDSPSICARCEAARYCNKDCQKKAWKKGHYFSCSAIKKAHGKFTNNLDTIKAAHADPDKHERQYGYKPNIRMDYLLMWSQVHRFLSNDGSYSIRESLPSMKHFYENIGNVKRGLLWCESLHTIPDLKSAAPMTLDDGKDESIEYMLRNGMALSYSYLDSKPGESLVEAFDRRNSELRANWLTLGPLIEQRPPPDSNCTAAEFLNAYIDPKGKNLDSFTRIFKADIKTQAYKILRRYDKWAGYEGLLRIKETKLAKLKSELAKLKSEMLFAELKKTNLQQEHARCVQELEIHETNLANEMKQRVHWELKYLFQCAKKDMVLLELKSLFQSDSIIENGRPNGGRNHEPRNYSRMKIGVNVAPAAESVEMRKHNRTSQC